MHDGKPAFLVHGNLQGVNLEKAKLRAVWAPCVHFDRANLKGADFSADKAQTAWWQALGNLVSLGTAIAGYGGTFVYHNAQMTNLTGATFVKADLSQALLKGVQLTAAISDKHY